MRIIAWSIFFGMLLVFCIYFAGVVLEIDVRGALLPGIALTRLFMDIQRSDPYYLRFFALLAVLTDVLTYSLFIAVGGYLLRKLVKSGRSD